MNEMYKERRAHDMSQKEETMIDLSSRSSRKGESQSPSLPQTTISLSLKSKSQRQSPRIDFDAKGKARIVSGTDPHSTRDPSPDRVDDRSPVVFASTSVSPNLYHDMNFQEETSDLFLQCPICGAETQNLYHLNHHIDTEHPEEQNDPTEAVMTWFKKVQSSVFNKKWQLPFQDATKKVAETSLEGLMRPNLGVFELNSNEPDGYEDDAREEYVSRMKSSGSTEFRLPWQDDSQASSSKDYANLPKTRNQSPVASSPDSLLPRHHWQKETSNDTCQYPLCAKPLGILAGKIHCRKCGKLYCDFHSRFQMRLSVNLKHDPQSGLWARVCLQCYQQRDGYNDMNGVSRNRTTGFLRLRGQTVNRTVLERNLIKLRLDKLMELRASPPKRSLVKSKSIADFFSATASGQKSVEKSVVSWESDKSSPCCTLCGQPFTLINRRHHCRLCGSLVDGPCIVNYMLPRADSAMIKICKVCNRHVDSEDSALDENEKPILPRLYEALRRHKSQVQQILPSFHILLVDLRNRPRVFAEDQEYKRALQTRKILMDHFSEIDRIAKTIKTLPSSLSSTKKVYENIYMATIYFLQNHMLTVQLLPEVTQAPTTANRPKLVLLPSENKSRFARLTPTQQAQVLDWEQQILVLEQQETQMELFIKDALASRKSEDAHSLMDHLAELQSEIDSLKGQLNGIFADIP